LEGIAGAVGGTAEALGGIAIGVGTGIESGGIGLVAGAYLLDQGLDGMETGLREAWTGQTQETSLQDVSLTLGANPHLIDELQLGADIPGIVAGGIGAVSLLSKFGMFGGGLNTDFHRLLILTITPTNFNARIFPKPRKSLKKRCILERSLPVYNKNYA
jgi:hypothetical protein